MVSSKIHALTQQTFFSRRTRPIATIALTFSSNCRKNEKDWFYECIALTWWQLGTWKYKYIYRGMEEKIMFKFSINFMETFEILTECVLILLSLSCYLVIREHFVAFSIPSHAKRKPTWRLRVWWLAKCVWYDVTWKHSIVKMTLFSWIFGRAWYPLVFEWPPGYCAQCQSAGMFFLPTGCVTAIWL